MIKTDPTMLVYDATPGPWTMADRSALDRFGSARIGPRGTHAIFWRCEA